MRSETDNIYTTHANPEKRDQICNTYDISRQKSKIDLTRKLTSKNMDDQYLNITARIDSKEINKPKKK